MFEKFKNQQENILVLLVLLNIIVLIAFSFKPAPATAASTATYNETWDSTEVAVTEPYYVFGIPDSYLPRGFNSKYRLVATPALPSVYSGKFGFKVMFDPWSYGLMATSDLSESPSHGFVTKWHVSGTLSR